MYYAALDVAVLKPKDIESSHKIHVRNCHDRHTEHKAPEHLCSYGSSKEYPSHSITEEHNVMGRRLLGIVCVEQWPNPIAHRGVHSEEAGQMLKRGYKSLNCMGYCYRI